MRSSRTGGTKSSHSSRAISRGGTNRMDHIHDNSPKIIELDELNSLSDGSAGLNSTHHLYDLLQKQVFHPLLSPLSSPYLHSSSVSFLFNSLLPFLTFPFSLSPFLSYLSPPLLSLLLLTLTPS